MVPTVGVSTQLRVTIRPALNLAFSDWPTIFPNAGSAIALIDRLIHHAEIIQIEGDSYRRRAAELTRKPPRPKSTS
jgi:DNA replication protein DnaC